MSPWTLAGAAVLALAGGGAVGAYAFWLADRKITRDALAAVVVDERVPLDVANAWAADPEALRRLLASVEEVATCESCEVNSAAFVVTWAPRDDEPTPDDALVCQACLPPGHVTGAKVERL